MSSYKLMLPYINRLKFLLVGVLGVGILAACGSGSSSSGGGVGGSGGGQFGALTFTIDGSNAFMSGELGATTAQELNRLVTENPQVTNIVMVNVPGSNDDEAAIPAYSIIRDNGLSTEIRSDGMVSSGGVDFFVAGVSRKIERGAKVGVHAWSNGTTSAASLPNDHPDHRLFIDYYIRMGLPDPEGFYFFTINAAPPEGIHYMSDAEINQYGLRN